MIYTSHAIRQYEECMKTEVLLAHNVTSQSDQVCANSVYILHIRLGSSVGLLQNRSVT